MNQRYKSLTVKDVAEICGVARSTVSYWIAKNALPAHRYGKKHLVYINDLVFFLKSENRLVPEILLENIEETYSQPIRIHKRCWEYCTTTLSDEKLCQECNVFNNKLNECFTAKNKTISLCKTNCHNCNYFIEYYGQLIGFIHQIDKPAAIYKDLYLWSGNRFWAELCDISMENLVGTGMEDFIHSESLRMFIQYNKQLNQGDPTVSDRYYVHFTDKKEGKVKICLTISPLKRPAGTRLVIAEKMDSENQTPMGLNTE